MKLRTLKIGKLIITPKMLSVFIFACFIQGIGIGASVASPNNSQFALVSCSIISLIILLSSFSRKKNSASNQNWEYNGIQAISDF